MDNHSSEAKKIRQAAARRPMLDLHAAERQLPDLVTAELGGEDVTLRFAEVLDAIAFYPELAEQYAALVGDMEWLLHESAGHPAPDVAPFITPTPSRQSATSRLHQLGSAGRGFLLQMTPPHPPTRQAAHLGHQDRQVILFNSWLEELPDMPQLSARLEGLADGWQLIVTLVPGAAERWIVHARVGTDALPIQVVDGKTTYFMPQPHYPTAPIQLTCTMQSAD
jgi:hypothetical protein